MLAVITRPMVIATDTGTAKQFVPLKDVSGEPVPQEMSEGEFGRLRRAGAAQRFIEVNHAEIETESTSGLLKTDLGSINGLGEDVSRVGAGNGPVVEAKRDAGNHVNSGVAAATLVAPVAKAGRKPKG